MTSTRPFLVPALAGVLFLMSSARAQDPTPDQVHPRTIVTLGFGIGSQDVENNTGNPDTNNPPAGILSRSADAFHFRLRAEYYTERRYGLFASAYVGKADDINEDPPFSSPDSSFDSIGVFVAAAYRATMGESFRLPVRFGPFFQRSEEKDSTSTIGTVERSTVGVKLSAEPEWILMQKFDGTNMNQLSAFAEVVCGAGPADVKADNLKEDGYAFTLGYELGLRYRFASRWLAGLSWFAQKNHIGATESYNNNAVFFGVDDDFTGVMLTAGVCF
jgi:hypothetical protein